MRRWIFWSGMVALALLVVAIATRRVGVERRLVRQAEATGCCDDCNPYRSAYFGDMTCPPNCAKTTRTFYKKDKCGHELEVYCEKPGTGACAFKVYYDKKLIGACCYRRGINLNGHFWYTKNDCRIVQVYWKTVDDTNDGSGEDEGTKQRWDWQYWQYDVCQDKLKRTCCEHPKSTKDEDCLESECECGPPSSP